MSDNNLTETSFESKEYVIIDITTFHEKLCFAFKEIKTNKIVIGDLDLDELISVGLNPNEIIQKFRLTGIVNPVIEVMAWVDAQNNS